jgi:hypothetical protein
MVLVAIAMVAIIAMAALSIDVITLYLAREEAQRSADTAALAAARVISVSGMTGDPNDSGFSWQAICGVGGSATQAATAVATQSAVAGSVAGVTVTYSAGGQSGTDCSSFTRGGAFSVNPMVTVQITRTSLPTFFSRIWGNAGNNVSATATAEALNPSASDANGNNGATGTVTPVLPSCVKPWVVPNLDPLNLPGCTNNCAAFVSTADGTIKHPGISTVGNGNTGVIGENFWLVPDCSPAHPGTCHLHINGTLQPQANYPAGYAGPPTSANLLYVPGLVGNPVVAIPSCATGDPYEEAVGGCDSPINYQCGVQNENTVDLTTENPTLSGDTTNGALCLTNQADVADLTESTGQDYFSPFEKPNAYPFQILAGSRNALGSGFAGTPISTSTSIVSLPIYDNGTIGNPIRINSGTTTNVTFVGFLQVFINAVDGNGNVNVTVLNVSGCGNGTSGNVGSTPVTGTSPVPIRLITPP